MARVTMIQALVLVKSVLGGKVIAVIDERDPDPVRPPSDRPLAR